MKLSVEKGNEIELKDEDDEDELMYAGPETELVGSNEEVLDSGFVIDEDSPEDIMDVFGSMDDSDADNYEE